MRILQLLSTQNFTGPAELCIEDGERLRERGHDVVFGINLRREGNLAQLLEDRGFEVVNDLALCSKSNAFKILGDVAHLRRRLAAVDLVHCRFTHDHSIAALARLWWGRRPAIVRTVENAPALRAGIFRTPMYRRTDVLLVSSDNYRQRLIQQHGLPPDRVSVVRGRVHADHFCPGDGGALRAELGLRPDDLLFGIVSRIKVERQHALLIRAFAKVAAKYPHAKLAIIGRGEYRPAMERLACDAGCEKNVYFAGYRAGEQLVEAYRGLDVKIWLAEGNDGTCRAVLEAMACGKPVIGGASGAMLDLIRPGVDGLLTPLDIDSLVASIESMLVSGRAAEMGRNALQRAREFTPERRASGLWEAYEAAYRRAGLAGVPAPAAQ